MSAAFIRRTVTHTGYSGSQQGMLSTSEQHIHNVKANSIDKNNRDAQLNLSAMHACGQ